MSRFTWFSDHDGSDPRFPLGKWCYIHVSIDLAVMFLLFNHHFNAVNQLPIQNDFKPGDLRHTCKDAVRSQSEPGRFWSLEACANPSVNSNECQAILGSVVVPVTQPTTTA